MNFMVMYLFLQNLVKIITIEFFRLSHEQKKTRI